jgi:EmrB/QacA subfamily drug resistance transporter
MRTTPAASRSATPVPGGIGDPGTGHPRRRAILGILCLSLLVVVIDNTVLNTALPTLARDLHAGTSALQWITDAYTLCFAALLIPAGALGDRYGRRRALIGGLLVFGLGSLAAAHAATAGMLIADRVVMGIGAAFVMPSTLSILTSVFPADERPQAIGAWAAVAGVGVVIGPTLGGALLTHFAWGSIFLVNVPLVLLALMLVVRVVPESADTRTHPLDLAGTVLVAAALVALVDGIIEAPQRGWGSAATLVELGAAVLLLLAFVRWELRHPYPLIDLTVFRQPSLAAATMAVAVIFFALFGSLFALTQYLQLVHGYSPLSAGLRALPFGIATGVTSPLSTPLARRFGSRVVIAGGLTMMGGGLLALSTAGVATAYPPLAVFVAIMGAGMGLVMAPASTTIMTGVPADQAGAGSAVNDTIREVGGALGVAVIGSLVASRYAARLRAPLIDHRAPAAVVHLATGSIAAADAVGRAVGGARGRELLLAAHWSFTTAMATGMRVAAAVALGGAVYCMIVLPRRRAGGLAVLAAPVTDDPVGPVPAACPPPGGLQGAAA